MKGTLLTTTIVEKVSQVYYDRTAKDLNELKPRDKVQVKPAGLVKGQEWKKGCVIKNHGYHSYAVETANC